MNSFIYLLLAIAAELVGTSSLKASKGFSELGPSLLVVIGYTAAFSFLSQSLKEIPIGTAYAIWSGIGTAGIALIGWWLFNEKLNLWAMVGIGFIIFGVVLLNFFSSSPA